MKIGQLAELTGSSLRSLRYYEQKGLLSPLRQDNGYREYSPLAVQQVQTIRFYLNLGLTTDQIASFLHCVIRNKESFCEEVLPIYQQKLEEIDEQIRSLNGIRNNLIDRIQSINNERVAGGSALSVSESLSTINDQAKPHTKGRET
ncbi:putative MerR family transcriptional regulator [Paenibacillus agaridevorans]|uniref:Putative MerR family transcriptional regulator n=1 Tax=Paenibacillus agaridevorans TaxID=171404 RepID=A0A2R5ELV5_9BACL|nr:MerR family transcriptional regulator [Paenibacillus agaridevorans]GBG07537.1 putative MerR family transcriptional regulator [Paenibacillus agaridevorans]